MSGRTVPTAARLSRTDLALLRRAERSVSSDIDPQPMPPGETVVWNDELRAVARLSPVFLDFFLLEGTYRVARITAEGRRVLAARRS